MPLNKELAERAIEWFPRYLRHTTGRWEGKPFELMPWQKEIVGKLFGTVNEKGFRQYRTVYVEIPKKNGKSELAAGIALFLLFADHEPGAEIYSAAGDKDQAAIVFNVAAKMVALNPKLSRRCKVLDASKRIVHNSLSFYRVLSAEVHTKHGFNSHGVVFDELHAQPDRNLWDVLTKGSGAARTQPVVVAITTAGFDRNSICYKMHEYARKVIAGTIKDPSFLGVIYGAGDKDDWRSESVWKKANPALGVILDIDDLRRDCKQAQEMPEEENSFRRLRLNQWVKQESRYIPMVAWSKCGGAIDETMLEARACWGGLDLASSTDIASFVMAFSIDNLVYLLPRFWVPSERMDVRSRRDGVPYDQWVKQGFMRATDGEATDYAVIESDIVALSKRFEIREVAFDRWGAIQMSQNLTRAGFEMIEFGQGYKEMSPSTKDFLKLILSRKIRHGDNPVLTWMADNVVVTVDPAENVKPDKKKSTERIDGIVASIMAIDRLQRNLGPAAPPLVNDPTPASITAGLRSREF